MTTIHSIVEPRKHVRVIAIGDGDVALDIGRPGRPAISLAAIRVPVADLWAALGDFAPAGSYTRTDEEIDPERARSLVQGRDELAEALDTTMGRAIKAERERDDSIHEREAAIRREGGHRNNARCWMETSEKWRGTAEEWEARAEQAEQALAEMTAHRDQCRDTAIKWQVEANRAVQPRALTPDDITDEMVKRAWDAFWNAPGEIADVNDMRVALRAALTPTRPEGAERWETWLSRLDYLHDETGASRADLATLANDLATEVGLTPTNPEEQA